MLAALKALLLPPGNLLVLALAALMLQRRWPRAAPATAFGALGLLYLLATPALSGFLLGLLEEPYADPLARPEAQAIVALGGGTAGMAPEYGADTVNQLSLVRVRYAARLQRLSGKPLLLSGGSVGGTSAPEARQMRSVLDELGIPVRWLEERSVDTYGNAQESARLLAAQGIHTVYLVTHAWHMPRARLAFEHAGLRVVPAPTGFSGAESRGLLLIDLLPSARGVLTSYYFCHEVLGYAAYALRIRWARSRSGVA